MSFAWTPQTCWSVWCDPVTPGLVTNLFLFSVLLLGKTPVGYSSVLNKNPVFLFGASAWTKFQCCLKSTVLVLGSSNFGFMSSFPFLISFDNEQGYCPARSWVLIAWMSPRMLIRSGLLLRTLHYLTEDHSGNSEHFLWAKHFTSSQIVGKSLLARDQLTSAFLGK